MLCGSETGDVLFVSNVVKLTAVAHGERHQMTDEFNKFLNFDKAKGQKLSIAQLASLLGAPTTLVSDQIVQHQIAGRARIYHTSRRVLYEYIG